MDMRKLDGWIPLRVFKGREGLRVDWCFLGARRFIEPFFDQTIAGVMRHPFNLVFRHQTSLDDLHALRPSLAVSGFIFHMSRCGSTLISQMISRLPHCVVMSEPECLGAILRTRIDGDAARPDDPRIGWFQGLVHALAQPRSGSERHLIIKFDAPSAAYLPLIRRAFPTVPYLFVYRDPLEVLVSHRRRRSGQMLPAVMNSAWLGMDLASAAFMSPDEYTAKVLARICQAAAEHHDPRTGRLLNFKELPGAVLQWIPRHFGIDEDPDGLSAMKQACEVHAKYPDEKFVADSAEKQAAADEQLRGVSEKWLRACYDRLDAVRNAHATGA
ncbi:MAG: hypothetical protein JWN51_3758 [Phycisphaerales bacterium]|nr:hypothetical protein [Phycisphaerales bacterium]